MPHVDPKLVEASRHIGSCLQCGRCCWDWKGNDPANKCEHLSVDMKLCTAHDCWDEPGFEGCKARHTLQQATSLPDDCGYMLAWGEAGLLCQLTT